MSAYMTFRKRQNHGDRKQTPRCRWLWLKEGGYKVTVGGIWGRGMELFHILIVQIDCMPKEWILLCANMYNKEAIGQDKKRLNNL